MMDLDYITGEGLRQSLESDFLELERSHAAKNWKSIHVLAGSIIEALLVDTLVALPGWSGKDPLAMQLSEVISSCKQEKIISERAADLSSVLRSYRNLIHPGRLVRLQESLPDETSADVARALVKMIVAEVAQKRRAVVGLTADQVVSKVLRDHNANSILRHILNEVSDKQRRRLLLDLFPAEYERVLEDSFGDGARFEVAFRTVLESSSEEIKRDVAAAAVAIIREADGDRVERYITAFFVATDIQFVLDKDRPLVVDHLLSMGSGDRQLLYQKKIEIWSGLSNYLAKENITRWVNEYVRTILYAREKSLRESAKNAFTWEAGSLKGELKRLLDARVDAWKGAVSSKPELIPIIDDLQQEIQDSHDFLYGSS